MINDGQHTGESRIDKADLRIGFGAESRCRTGKQFRF